MQSISAVLCFVDLLLSHTMITATIVAMRPPMMRVVTTPAKNIPTKRAAILSVADNENMSIHCTYSGCRQHVSFDISPASGEYVDDCTTVTDGDIECSSIAVVDDGSTEVVLPLVYYMLKKPTKKLFVI